MVRKSDAIDPLLRPMFYFDYASTRGADNDQIDFVRLKLVGYRKGQV